MSFTFTLNRLCLFPSQAELKSYQKPHVTEVWDSYLLEHANPVDQVA